MVKKEDEKMTHDNSFGISSINMSILSVCFSLLLPIWGLVLGVIGLVFAKQQNKRSRNKWSKYGFILSIIGIVLSIIAVIVSIWVAQNAPEYLGQLEGIAQ